MSTAMRTISGAVFASLVAMTTAVAQHTRPSYGIGAGLTVPTGDFHADANGDGYNAGWQGTALVEFKLPQTAIGVRLDGSYSENSANDKLKSDISALVGAPSDSKTKTLGGSVDLTYEFPSSSPAKAYVLAGIGMYNFKVSVTSGNVTADTSKTRFAWNTGAGLNYGVGGAALFVEVRFFDISAPFGGSDIKYVPIIVGVRFGAM